MGTVAQDRRETKNQEKDVSLPAFQPPRPSYSRPCLTYQQACGEGALPHLHAACLQRAHWPGNQPRPWSGTWLWTWPRSCLWPGLCQWCPCGPNQTRPCVHWISSLYSGSSHWPSCWPSGGPPCRDRKKLPEDAVVIRVSHCAVHWVDLLMMAGQYQQAPPLPYTPGMEYSGTVVSAPAGSGLEEGSAIYISGILE